MFRAHALPTALLGISISTFRNKILQLCENKIHVPSTGAQFCFYLKVEEKLNFQNLLMFKCIFLPATEAIIKFMFKF